LQIYAQLFGFAKFTSFFFRKSQPELPAGRVSLKLPFARFYFVLFNFVFLIYPAIIVKRTIRIVRKKGLPLLT